MRRILHARIVAAMLGAAAALSAQAASPPRLERLENPTGPSHNSIFAIAQDQQGFLWVGTQDGLNRYDGYEFRVWRHDPRDPDTISANRVNAVLEDSQNRLWVGTVVGVDRLDRANNRFRRYTLPGAADATVLDLTEDTTGSVWAGTSAGLFVYRAQKDRWEEIAPAAGLRRIPALAAAGGSIWALEALDRLDATELLEISDERVVERYTIPFDTFDLTVGGDGALWLHPAGPAVPEADTVRLIGVDDPAALPAIRSIVADPEVGAWGGGRNGFFVNDPEVGLRRLDPDPATQLDSFVAALARDRDGRIWLGTENGLYVHDPHAKPFRHIGPRRGGLETLHVSALAEDRERRLWVGTFGDGVFRLRDEPGSVATLERPAWSRQERVWSLLAGPGELIIGVDQGLCVRTAAGLRCGPRPSHSHSLALAPPLDPALSEELELWGVGAGGKLWRQRAPGDAIEVYVYDGEPHIDLSEEFIHLLPDGDRIWVASFGGALKVFDRREARYELVDRTDASGWTQLSAILDLHRDRKGILWLGTGDGLSRFDPEAGTFVHYTVDDGLPGSNVYGILEDDAGRLWLGTNRGLARFDPRAPPDRRFRTYGREDGVLNVEFNRHARLRTSGGWFLFGGLAGVTAFRPEEIRDNPAPPRVAITAVEILGGTGTRDLEPHALAGIELTPRDSVLTVQYTSLGFTSPSRNRYAYRLDGLDSDWVAAGDTRVVRYSGLAPGDYVLRIKAANNDGVWNESGAALAITVLPPVWATWWFRLAVLVLLAGVLTWSYRRRLRRLLELERMRLRIASDLHDELGSELSGIALSSSMLGRREQLSELDRGRLRQIQRAALGVMQGLRDIVWYINPEHDSLESMERRMRSVAETVLGDIDYTLETDLEGSAEVDMDVRRNLFLIYKEAVANAARHSGADSIAVRFRARNGVVTLEVADDGAGFDPAAATDGTGLASLRRRAAEAGAALDIVSAPGQGTSVRVQVGER